MDALLKCIMGTEIEHEQRDPWRGDVLEGAKPKAGAFKLCKFINMMVLLPNVYLVRLR